MLSYSGILQVYKQQQAAVATEGSKETRFFEGTLPPCQTSCPALSCQALQ